MLLVGTDSEIDGSRGLSPLSGRVPNTNKHSMEGSNPIWLQAYENEWYKHNDDDFSQASENDSLDENVLCSTESLNCEDIEHQNNLNRSQNVYQTLPAVVSASNNNNNTNNSNNNVSNNNKKLETTEL